MTSANLELVRSILAAWERGDFSSADWAHPEIEYVIPDGPEPGRWKRVDGMARANRDFMSAWEDFRLEVDEYRELDDQRVLVLVRRSGRGRTSGLEIGPLRSRGAGLFYVRGGQVTRLVFYSDGERALVDLGLARRADDRCRM